MKISKTSGLVTVYDKDGNASEIFPIDAREQLEMGLIYLEKPVPVVEKPKKETKKAEVKEVAEEKSESDFTITEELNLDEEADKEAPKRRGKPK